MRQDPRFQIRALAAAAMLALALPASAQLSSATVRGAVTAEAKAQVGATVTATNTATGQVTRTTSRADGSYVLVGLAPGSYKLEIAAVGFETRTQPLTVLVGQTLDIDLPLARTGTTQLNTVVVTGLAGAGRKTSELGTNLTQKQIDSLPQINRNFLAFADLAPGVRFDVDPKTGQGTLRGGAQNQDNVNIFIDGVSQKNYILRGGATGMDSTRGNPFPQSAIAEYKVLSSNYKAEFDQVSSTAVSAVTKSGTNELHGEIFFDRTGDNWRAYSPFEKQAKDQGNDRAGFSQYQYGFSLGGPIKENVAHYFVAVEAKDIDDARTVLAPNLDKLPQAGIVPDLVSQRGSFVQKFKERLFLGKLDLQINDANRLEFTARLRKEDDRAFPEDPSLSVITNTKNRINDETRLNLKHEWTGAELLNELNLGYEDYRWSPRSNTSDPFIKYKYSNTNVLSGAADVIFVGGSPDAQDKNQKGLLFQDDITYTGLAGHTTKGGVKVKDLKFDLTGTRQSVDTVQTVIDNVTGQPYYSGGNCTSAAPAPSDTSSSTASCLIDRATPGVNVQYKDKQFGIYLQDDWAITKSLELNLGVRWDYETNMLNDKYVTPADRVAIFSQQDPRAGAPVGQTYAQSLAKGGVSIADFLSDGSSRKAFKGALQPRLGFSYDITGDKDAVVFGGVGRAYDRTNANFAIDETINNAVPGRGDIFLIKNDHKMPFTDQFTLGLRKGAGAWNTELGVNYQRGHNQFNWYNGNRDPQGGYGTQAPIDPLWGSVGSYGNLVLGDFVTQTKTMSLYFKLDKPYTKSSGWGVAATYTYTDGQTTNREWTDDTFNWTYGRTSSDFHASKNVERHRLVTTGVTDGLLPWGLQVSGKMTLGSGLPRQLTDCHGGFSPNTCTYVKADGHAFRQFDVGFSKEVALGLGKFSIRADIINLLNTENFGGYDDWVGGPSVPAKNAYGGDNANLGTPNSLSGPMRTLKLSMRYQF